MNAPEYLRGRCEQCSGEIEFPATAIEQSTTCPLCQQTTHLVAVPATPAAAATSAKRGPKRGVMFATLGVVVIAIASVVLSSRTKSVPDSVTSPTTTNSETKNAPATTPTNATTAADTNSTPATPTKPRSIEDLKASPVSLEKAKNSSLVYAVGTLRNESDHQRFGVTVEVELTDARGNDAGKAKDYRAVIEPRQEWRFRALVLNSKATEGKVARVREE